MPKDQDVPAHQVDYRPDGKYIWPVFYSDFKEDHFIANTQSAGAHNTLESVHAVGNFLEAMCQLFIETPSHEYEHRERLISHFIRAGNMYTSYLNTAHHQDYRYRKEIEILNDPDATVLEDRANVERFYGRLI